MITSEQIQDLAAAMAKAQAAMKPAIKDSTNPAFRSKYADLTAVWDACRGPLTANGITVWQDVLATDSGIAVTTRLTHASGQWVEFGPLIVPLTKRDAHGVGSATSYGRRYGLSAAIGIVADDDDGNAAVASTDVRVVLAEPSQSTTQTVTCPNGYDEWLMDLIAAADNGIAEFESAFGKSKIEFRRHLTQADVERYGNLRAKARRVGAPLKVTK